MQLIDETIENKDSRTTLTRVYHHGVEIVRVQVERDGYKPQSYARAAVLARDRSAWTVLAVTPADGWYADCQGPVEVRLPKRVTRLAAVADELAKRAELILG